MSTDWKQAERWTRQGKDFMVEVYHYTVALREEAACYDSDGGHRWNVYAYIYPKHPHFAQFVRGDGMWQEAASMLGFHGGPSVLEFPQYDDKVTCVKVGCDYNHLHDTEYTRIETKDEAFCVFQDADVLFNRLQRMSDDAKATGEQA